MPTSASRPLEERELHRWARTHLPAGHSGMLPLGDDTAALPTDRYRAVLLSSDALVEGVHFRRSTPPRRIGEAVAAFNLSDIAAKGGHPAALLVDLLAPPRTPASWAQALLLGAEAMASRFDCHVVGGDTKPSATRTVVGVSIGWVTGRALPTRGGAHIGDAIVTTGTVGFGGAFRDDASKALRVVPRIREGMVLGPVVHAMTDTSDGIADAARLVSAASRKKLILESERLPLHPNLGPPGHPTVRQLHAAFYGGDYELLATVPPRRVSALQQSLRRFRCPLTVVGRVEAGHGAWLERGGRLTPMPSAGWRHFA